MNDQATPSDEGFISRNEAAKVIGVSPATLTSWRHRKKDKDGGPPPCHRISPTHYVYRRSELIAWVEQFRITNGVKITPPKPGQPPRPWES